MLIDWTPPAGLALGYLLGSIPFGLLLTRFAGTSDIRSIGSGNIGATNVLRTGRKDLAVATLLLDALKGTFAVLLAMRLGPFAGLAAAVGAFLGHVYPVWLGFRGGKGVTTFLGALFGLSWPVGLVFVAVWLAVAFATRYSSAAALAASAVTPPALLVFASLQTALVMLGLEAVLWWKHRANIGRLRDGSEGKIGQKG